MERLPEGLLRAGLPDELELSEGAVIDPKIRNLVAVINVYGEGIITTKSSCQGHLDDGRGHPFPWVGMWPPHRPEDQEMLISLRGINLSEIEDAHRRAVIEQRIESLEKLEELKGVVEEFNAESDVRWIISGMYLEPEIPANSEEELLRVQKSADELARHILKITTFPG